MTLAAKILALNDGKRTTREIAEIVYGKGCPEKRLSYVRVVLRQRKGKGVSANDRRYASSPLGRERHKRAGRVYRQRHKDEIRVFERALIATADKEAARSAWRVAYRAARARGLGLREANRVANRAYLRVLRATADRQAAHKARKSYALARRQPDRTDASECRT